jgi:dTDP-4-amino-4,6-dideoxygalactose transaminase
VAVRQKYDVPMFRAYVHPDADERVLRVLRSGWLGQGAVVDEFEAVLRDLLESGPLTPVTTASGTAALELALDLVDVRAGDVVVSTPITFAATNTVLVRRGARIAWADVDPVTGLLTPETVSEALGRHPTARAIMSVDWGGQLPDYDAMRQAAADDVAQWRGAPPVPALIVEDAAHAFGARTEAGEPISRGGGDVVCWSFQAIKHLSCGNGGAVLPSGRPDDPNWHGLWAQQIVERARRLRYFGLDRDDTESEPWDRVIREAGGKLHLSDVEAAIGLANAQAAPNILWRHRHTAAEYATALADLETVGLPPAAAGGSWWLYLVRVRDPRAFCSWMADRGVEVSPVHPRNDTQPAFSRAAVNRTARRPGVDAYAAHAVALPTGWHLTPRDRASVIEGVREWDAAERLVSCRSRWTPSSTPGSSARPAGNGAACAA